MSTPLVLLNVEQTGMVSGWTSPVLARLQDPASPIPITSEEGSWMATIMSVVGVFATPLSALSVDYLGRKLSILLTTIPFIISWIWIACSTTVTDLIIGRSISGIGIAFSLSVTPIYLCEIATDDIRGGIGIYMTVFTNIGILWMYCVGVLPELWISSALAILPLLIVIGFYFWIPESPYYLLTNDKKEDAVTVLKKLRNTSDVDVEIKKIEATIVSNSKDSMFKEFFTDVSHRRALLVCIGVVTIAQCTGGITLVIYAHLIFKKAGDVSMYTLAIVKAVLQLITSFGAAYVVDRLGRKPLLIVSCIGSAFFMGCEGVYFFLLDYGYNVDPIWWLPLFAMVMFNVSQVIGLSSISISFFGELFHPKVKSLCVCISKAYMSLMIVVVGKLFQILTDAFGNCVPFFVFTAVGLFGVVFVVFVVPETKGKSLDEIQYYFKHKAFPVTETLNRKEIECVF